MRSTAHEHRWRIVSHTIDKPMRVLLGCACSATMNPKEGAQLGGYEHLCCQPAKVAKAA